ncbi:MAG: hypothetical protein ACFE0S_00785 [Rhodospirillales bacterium]
MTDPLLDERYTQAIGTPDLKSLPDKLANIYRTWEDLRGVRAMPAFEELGWDALPPSIVSWCSLVDVVQYPLDFIYRYWGEKRTELMARTTRGYPFSISDPLSFPTRYYKEYVTLMERRAPISITTFGMGMNQDESYSFLRLPFGKDECIEQVLSISGATTPRFKNSKNTWTD